MPINYPELGPVSEHRRWYDEGEEFDHPSGIKLRVVKDPAGRTINGKPMLIWQAAEPPK